jgi:hypothetical protein
VKSGPFYEHSNQLYNISGTASWTKINQGLIKMYKGEVLGKYPVVQHTLFGSLLSIAPFDKNKNPGGGKKMSVDDNSNTGPGGRHVPPNLGRALSASKLATPAPPVFKE